MHHPSLIRRLASATTALVAAAGLTFAGGSAAHAASAVTQTRSPN